MRMRAVPLLLAAALAAGCGGARSAAPAPAAKLRQIGANEAYRTPLGTPLATIARRFGQPVARYRQPMARGARPLQCLVYLGGGDGAFVRFCFAHAKLTVVATVFGRAALQPSPPATAGGRRLHLHKHAKRAGGELG
jgi:hypothetical protein